MTKTISQLEVEGYTAILCECRDPKCRNRVAYPFKLIRNERPKLMLSAMTIDELGAKMPCGKCGSRDVAYRPHRQSDAPGFARRY
jgi:hypothetical protein